MPVVAKNQRPMPWSQFLDLLKSHKNYWLLCLGLLVANLLFYLVFIAGEIEQIDQLQKRYQDKRKGLTEIRKLQRRASDYADSQKAWQIFRETAANKITFPDRLNDLEALFHRHNLDPSGMSFKSEKVAGLPLVRFVSAIEAAGNYADLKALLHGIRQLPGLFCIEGLSIDKNRQAGTLVVKMDLAAYFHDAPGH
jgi:Tfp pilus assembly protein PilO